MTELAEEILMKIFSNIIKTKDILPIRMVCHRWNNLILNDLALCYHYTFAFGEIMHSLSVCGQQKLKNTRMSRFTLEKLKESDIILAITDVEVELKYSKRRDLDFEIPELHSILREIHSMFSVENKLNVRLLIAPDENLNFVSANVSNIGLFDEFHNFSLTQAVINLYEITDNRTDSRQSQISKLQYLFKGCEDLKRLGILPITTLINLHSVCVIGNLTHLDVTFGRRDSEIPQTSLEWLAQQYVNLKFLRIRTCKPLDYKGLKFAKNLKHLRFDLVNLRTEETLMFWSSTNFDICLTNVVSLEIDFNLLTDLQLGNELYHIFMMTPRLKSLTLLSWNIEILVGLLQALKFGCFRELEVLNLHSRHPVKLITESMQVLSEFLTVPNELPQLKRLKVFKTDLKNIQPDNQLLLSLIENSPVTATVIEANFYLPHNLLTGWTDKIVEYPIFEQEILSIVEALNSHSTVLLSCLCTVNSFKYSRSGIISNSFKRLSAKDLFTWREMRYSEKLIMEDHRSNLISKLHWKSLKNEEKTLEIRFQF